MDVVGVDRRGAKGKGRASGYHLLVGAPARMHSRREDGRRCSRSGIDSRRAGHVGGAVAREQKGHISFKENREMIGFRFVLAR
jgi:hypothetical protein